VRFYGQKEPWMPHLVARFGLQDIVEIGGLVAREKAIRHQAESQLLLLLGWSDPRETGQHTGKLFEYFGSSRPILAVGGAKGVLTETLLETRAGVHIQGKKELRQYLLSSYKEFKSRGFVTYHADPEAIRRYTHSEMAKRFSDVLIEMICRYGSTKKDSQVVIGNGFQHASRHRQDSPSPESEMAVEVNPK
jgi:hypothetical protein